MVRGEVTVRKPGAQRLGGQVRERGELAAQRVREVVERRWASRSA